MQVQSMIPKFMLLFFILVFVLSGCGPEPPTDCEEGLCGHNWALELDSAVARGEALVQAQPNDVNALLGLADAYVQKASFINNQTDTRADSWFSSNVKKIERLLDEALKASEEVLLQKKDSAEAYDLKGRAYFVRSQLNHEWETQYSVLGKSISYHEKAVSLRPTSAEMWFHLGIARQRIWSWSPEITQQCFEKAIELDRTFSKAFAALAWYGKYVSGGIFSTGKQLGSENLKKIERFLNEALRASDDPDVLRVVADMYSDNQVKTAYIQSIRSVPNVAKAPFVLGFSSFLPKGGELEFKVYKRIVCLDHHFSKDHRSLFRYSLYKGILQSSDGRFESYEKGSLNEALSHLKIWAEAIGVDGEWDVREWWGVGQEVLSNAMTKRFPTASWAFIYCGKGAGNLDAATGLFKRAIALDSRLAIAYYFLAATEAQREDWVSADGWSAEALRRSQNDEFVTLNAHLLRMLIHARRGAIPKVIQECKRALQIDSAYVALALRWGIYGKSGPNELLFRLDEPIGLGSVRTTSDRKIASLLDLSSGWGYWRGQAWGDKYNKFFQKAIDLDPENLEAYFALASMYFARDYDQGINLIKKVIRLHPENAKAHKNLANLYLSKNLLDKAKQELELAYTLGNFESRIALEDLEKSRAQQRGQ